MLFCSGEDTTGINGVVQNQQTSAEPTRTPPNTPEGGTSRDSPVTVEEKVTGDTGNGPSEKQLPEVEAIIQEVMPPQSEAAPQAESQSGNVSQMDSQSEVGSQSDSQSDVMLEVANQSDVLPEVAIQSDVLPEVVIQSDVLPEVVLQSDVLPEVVSQSDDLHKVTSQSDVLPEVTSQSGVLPEVASQSDVSCEDVINVAAVPSQPPVAEIISEPQAALVGNGSVEKVA